MNIRPAVESDLPFVVDLVNAAYRGRGPVAGWTDEAAYIDGGRTTTDMLVNDLGSKPGSVLLVCRDEAEEKLTGCVWLEPQSGGTWYLGMLTVRPDLQDKGLGRHLLSTAEAYAAAHGARGIRMTVVHLRDTLIAWYLRRGYVLTGETEPFPYEDARFGDPRRGDLHFVVLQKMLA